jgi:circadian clock protein KaiC
MKLLSTGVKGLDDMLGGGIPEGKIILVCGGTGTGKTIFSIQVLLQALSRGEACVFTTLEEPMPSIRQNLLAFGWNLSDWERKGLLKALDLRMLPTSSFARDRETGDSQLSTSEILAAINETRAKVVAIDPLTSLVIQEARSGRKRFLIGEFFESLRKLGCTVVVTSETSPQEGDFYMEQFLADGVILLGKDVRDYKLVKTLRIDKMRGLAYDEQPRRYTISSRGFQVFNTEPVLV